MKIVKTEVALAEKSSSRTRVYFFVDKESIFENLVNRRSRPYAEYRKLLPEVFERAQFDPGYTDLNLKNARWSQKAGCQCGCSPGFILDKHHGCEVFVTVSYEDEKVAA